MIQAIQFFLALSFLVMIHELGHFTFARIFGVRVEKFYMFFNPKISLVRFKKFEGRWHFAFFQPNTDENHEWNQHPETTEWGIGWLPFGGYCAIGGMVDETHSAEEIASKPAEDWEFRAKPAWQRLLIILGGILVNFVGAMMIFSALTFRYGTSYVPFSGIEGLEYSTLMQSQGFVDGDRILTVNGQEPERLQDLVQLLIIEGKTDVVVLRGADTIGLTMDADLGTRYLAEQNEHQRKQRDLARADKEYVKQPYWSFRAMNVPEPIHRDYTLLESIPAGWKLGWSFLESYVKQFRLVFTKEGAQSVGGFGAIGSMFPDAWNWAAFWQMTAILSIILAFMNFLPIPALDGGYILFLLYEIVTRRKPSDTFLERANEVGFWLLMALLIFANGNDILKLFF